MLVTFVVAEHTRHEPDDRVDNDHRGNLAPIEDEIADRYFLRFEQIDNSLIKPFVPAAQQQQSLVAGKFFHKLLIESPPLGGQQHDACWRFGHRLDGLDALDDRFGFENHAWSTAEGSIINVVVFSCGPIANVVEVDLDQRVLDGQVQQALPEVSRKHFREQG